MIETETRHSAMFSIYNFGILASCGFVCSSFPLTASRVTEIVKLTGPLKHPVPGRFARKSFHS